MEDAAGGKFALQHGDEFRLHDSPFVMSLFVPRVREKQIDPVEAFVGNMGGQNFYRIIHNEAYISEFCFFNS